MFWPTTNGASTIYKVVLRPFLVKYQDQIDKHVDRVEEGFDDAMKYAKDKAPGAAMSAASYGMQKASEIKSQ